MQEFLDRFAATIGEDDHVLMMLDRAGWHGSGDLRVPDNITLEPLPAYSPELNPVERIWLYLHGCPVWFLWTWRTALTQLRFESLPASSNTESDQRHATPQ
jgi:DDE superfamily endonuclease